MRHTTTPWRRWAGAAALAVVTAALLPACTRGPSPQGVELTVAVAASMAPAVRDIADAFRQETGIRVVPTLGASGHLAQQVAAGAPVDVFISADTGYVDELDRQGQLLPGTRTVYARGRLVLWARDDSPLALQAVDDLAGPQVRRVAIPHPTRAPYGAAAREALQRRGLWESVQPRLVIAEDALQAMAYAEAGDVDAALAPLSLALAAGHGRWLLVPRELHRPIEQAMAAVGRTAHPEEARRFVDYMTGPVGRAVLERYGYEVP